MDKMLGVMIDCSRNAVMNVETVKRYAKIIKAMGYNTLMLYTEDTYEVNNQPFFGHFRGRYSKDELKEIDSFCNDIGIELVPCIQTLAHLDSMFKWYEVYGDVHDCDDILLVGDDKTYALIEDMISTVSECFTSRRIHIGMDEAERVGKGKYFKKHGEQNRFDIINSHLEKVCEIAEKYGFEPMIWSDMFVRLASESENYYDDADVSKITKKANLPENVSLVYWDYYNNNYEQYAKMIKTNKIFGRKVYFAGGAWTWRAFGPDNSLSIKRTQAALRACGDLGVDGVIMTMWGDDGSECSKFAVLPALMYAAEAFHGNYDIDKMKSKFFDIVGCDFDNFMLLDKMDTTAGEHFVWSSKYIFYNDLFLGIRDFRSTDGDYDYYDKLSEKIDNLDNIGEYKYIFDAYKKLCDVLKLKSTLGIRTRNEYQSRNIEALKDISNDYSTLLERTEDFYNTFQKLWFLENKPHGFDVQDIRIGGLIQRIKSCHRRLNDFIDGKVDMIPELEEKALDKDNWQPFWSRMATPNRLSHMF